VPPAEAGRIFARFERGSSTGGEGGFGLGLAIGRELAERLGGRLELRDDGVPGAAFRLTLPLEDLHGA
jgi:signal transduction histidine kinase